MNFSNRLRHLAVWGRVWGLALLAALGVLDVAAQSYPHKPLSIVVGFATGGALDSCMRALAPALSKSLKQSVIVDNKTGMAGVNATHAVLTAPADGHVLLAAALTLGTSPYLAPIHYNPTTALTMVGQVASVPVYLLVRADSPIRNAKDIVALARKQSDGVRVGSGGVGTTGHFGALLVGAALNTQVTHVPFRGGAPALAALVAGEVNLVFDQPSTVLQAHLASGKLRAIAIMQNTRFSLTPEVKTAKEIGLNLDVPLRGWHGLAVRAGTPSAVVQTLSEALAMAVKSPAFAKDIQRLGLELVTHTSPEQFQKLYLSELAYWGKFIQKHRITVP